MKCQFISSKLRVFFTLIILLFCLNAFSQEMTMYVIPPKAPISWKSPRSLFVSYVRNLLIPNKYPKYAHPLGHIVIELRDSSRYSIEGMVAKSRTELGTKVCMKGYGMGVVFAPAEGELREGQHNVTDMMKRYPDGDVAYIRMKLSREAFEKLWQYKKEFKQYGFDKLYNGENKPREGKGAGCSAYGVSFAEIAGLIPVDILAKWKVSVDIPEKLIGGPMRDNRRILMSQILLKGKWADTLDDDYRTASYYEPLLIFKWIQDEWRKTEQESGYNKELRGNAKGLVADCTQRIMPDEPVWKIAQPAIATTLKQ